uniref:Ig-like domain-containing protein n=1 Tax=Terrapene triunguis TaxID=2587831 RepID=A0A674JWI1_9SAUR
MEWHKKSFVYQRIKPPISIIPWVPVRSFEPYSEIIGTIYNTHMCTLCDRYSHFTVTGPDHPVIASLGGETVLPCHLSPRMRAENMEVRWFRSWFSPVVHLYRDGQDQYGQQMLEYRGRTELLKDNITNGSVSLRIRDIRLSDDGQYKCFFQSSVSYEDALLELQVAGLGSDPVISVEGHQNGGIRVVCRSSGWYPKPEVLWRDLQGQLLPSASEKISQEADVTASPLSKCPAFILYVFTPKSMALSLAELFFPRVNPWMVVLGVILSLLAVLMALASYCFWRQHRGEVTKGWAWNSDIRNLAVCFLGPSSAPLPPVCACIPPSLRLSK